jgi:low temperature requirement protein LtrA
MKNIKNKGRFAQRAFLMPAIIAIIILALTLRTVFTPTFTAPQIKFFLKALTKGGKNDIKRVENKK